MSFILQPSHLHNAEEMQKVMQKENMGKIKNGTVNDSGKQYKQAK